MPTRTNHKISLALLLGILLTANGYAQQNFSSVFGRVIDRETGEPQEFVNVYAKELVGGKNPGTVTKEDGTFFFRMNLLPPYTLVVSYLGYKTREFRIKDRITNELIVRLEKGDLELDEVEIRSSIITEEVLKAPITIEQIQIQDIQYTPAFDFYDVLAGMRDVEISTQSMQFKSVNSRGFNSTGNNRFIQLIDGVDNQAPGFGFPVGNFAGIPELDIESAELLPGPSTSRYANAFNGLLFMKSRDPFLYQGFSSSFKVAANNFPVRSTGSGFFDFGASGVYEFGFRYAKAFLNERFAIKTNVNIITASDWEGSNLDNIGTGERFRRPFGDFPTAGYDGINVYGDEVQALLPIGPGGTNMVVTRTGYAETDLFDYDFTNFKIDGSLHYKLSDSTQVMIQGKVGTGNTFYTGDNRNFLGNFTLYQITGEVKSQRLTSRFYTTQQRSGDSFDARFLALHLMRESKSDTDWFNDYLLAWTGVLSSRGFGRENLEAAREAADTALGFHEDEQDRLEPGTAQYEGVRRRIINVEGFDEGAAFTDNSGLYHMEAFYDMAGLTPFVDVEVGAHYRLYDPESGGNIFPDTVGNDITMHEYGGYVELGRDITEKIRGTVSTRIDKNENFSPKFTPRASLVYRQNEDSYIRLSFQSGFRNPSLREQHIFQNLGEATLVGGLRPYLDQLHLPGNAFFTQTVDRFNESITALTQPDPFDETAQRFGQSQAELLSQSILQDNIIQEEDIKEIISEKVNSWEIGYRSIIAQNKVVIDVNYYFNLYRDFIGLNRAIRPKTGPDTDFFLTSRQVNNSTERDLFFIYANATKTVTTQGLGFNIDYTSKGGFILGMNGTWAKINSKTDDPIIPGFNTPSFKLNYTLGHNKVTDNIGFKFNLITRPSFQWESNFGDGEVEDYFNLDFQVNYRIPSLHGMIKFGISNLGNDYYANIFGGPQIGALPYIQFTYDPLFY